MTLFGVCLALMATWTLYKLAVSRNGEIRLGCLAVALGLLLAGSCIVTGLVMFYNLVGSVISYATL